MNTIRYYMLCTVLFASVLCWGQTHPQPVSLTAFHASALTAQTDDEAGQSGVLTQQHPSHSKGKAFLLSFILPGAGEYYAGSSKMARIFFGTEIALWSAFGTLRYYGARIENEYQLFAKAHAGVDISGKDHEFFVDIENFNNLENYNQYKMQQRSLNEMYPENPDYHWEWDSQENRFKYSKMRIKSDSAYRHSLFIAGGIFINHLISSIDAVRLVHKNQQAQENHKTLIGLAPLPGGAQVSLIKIF